MKTLLGVESLEPRTLLAGLCDIASSALQPPVESLPAPAAEVGSTYGDMGSSLQQTTPSVDDRAPPLDTTPSAPPPVDSPSDPPKSNAAPTQPFGPLQPPSEPDLTLPKDESDPTDQNPSTNSDLTSETGNSTTTDALSPSSSADSGLVSKSAASPTPFADAPARAGSPSAPSFVSLFVTASSAPLEKQLGPLSAVHGDSTEDPSAFHYFEPTAASRQDGAHLDSEPLANIAARQTFVAFWLMTKKDLEELQIQHAVIDSTVTATHAASSEPEPDHHQVEKSITAVTQQTDVVQKALAAIYSVDDVIRQADAACALATSRTAEPTAFVEAAVAQALASSATKINQPTSPQTAASQPSSPRWQLGMCSLVSILFSFRPPTKSSDKPTATRKSLFRVSQRTT